MSALSLSRSLALACQARHVGFSTAAFAPGTDALERVSSKKQDAGITKRLETRLHLVLCLPELTTMSSSCLTVKEV